MQWPLIQKHMPQLDVLRGLAIASVLLYHGIYWTENNQPDRLANAITHVTLFGWLGVNLFFVLSGFLITGILLDTKDRVGYFSNFYIRRALRILPVYLLTIAVLMALHRLSSGGVLLSLTFLTNYQLIPGAKLYSPFWSLSVEEQFYLVWPLIVFFCSRRVLTVIAGSLCILEPLLRALAGFSNSNEGLVHGATFLIGDNLAVGALAALFVRSQHGTRQNARAAAGGLLVLSAVILVCGVPFGLLHRTSVVGSALQTVPFNLIFTAMLLGSLAFSTSIFSAQLFLPLRWLGDISYGLYLMHMIVFLEYDEFTRRHATFYGHFRDLLWRLCVCALFSMGIAWLSRRYYEEPFLRLKTKLAPRTMAGSSQPILEKTSEQGGACPVSQEVER